MKEQRSDVVVAHHAPQFPNDEERHEGAKDKSGSDEQVTEA
jgi:hypothetical protein